MLCALTLQGSVDLSWWYVLLPVVLSAASILVAFTIACGVWIHGALRLCSAASAAHGNQTPDVGDLEYRLDILFKTAKICFICHGYTTLLCIALWLLVMKLEYWHKMATVYPLVPIIVLGCLHIFLAIMFKQPEIDSPRSAGIGLSMLAHVVALVLKIDHGGGVRGDTASGSGGEAMMTQFTMSGALAHEDGPVATSYPWAVVFIPSWLTYAWVAFACVRQGRWAFSRLYHDQEDAAAEKDRVNAKRALWVCAGGVLWTMGFCSSQVCLALKLDGLLAKKGLTWIMILTPAILGWCALVILGVGSVGRYFGNLALQLTGTFAPSTAEPDSEPPSVTTGLLSGIANDDRPGP